MTMTVLPNRRESWRMTARIGGPDDAGGVRVYLTVGFLYGGNPEDKIEGPPLEIFLDCARVRPDLDAMLSVMARSFSKNLQAGVPLDDVVDIMVLTQFEPRGMVEGGSERIPFCTSILDWVGKELGLYYLGREEYDPKTPR